MPRTTPIGNLAAIISGNADLLAQEVKRADGIIQTSANLTAQGMNKIEQATLRAGTQFLGARTAAALIAREIKDVIQNIDSIPGVPQETVDSIHRLNFELNSSNGVIKQAAATAAGWFSNLGTGIGLAFGNMLYGEQAAADGFEKLNAEADAFAQKDFRAKFASIENELERLEANTKGKMSKILSDEAAALANFAETGTLNIEGLNNAMLENLQLQMQIQGGATESDKQSAALQAEKDKVAVQRTQNELIREFKDGQDKYLELLDKESRANLASRDALIQVNAQIDKLMGKKVPNVYDSPNTVDPVELEKAIKDNAKLNKLEEERITLLKESQKWVGKLADEVSSTLVESLNGAGDAWKNLGRTIIKEIEKVIIETELLVPLFHSLGGGATSMGFSAIGAALTAYGGARAGGGGVGSGSSYLVGEEGPEMFVPSTAGSVIPAGATAGLLGSSGTGGHTFNFNYSFQTGVTRQEIAGLMPKMVESAKAAVADAMARGGGYRKAFA